MSTCIIVYVACLRLKQNNNNLSDIVIRIIILSYTTAPNGY